MMSDWCILRMAGRSTLPLAEYLGSLGLTVWTPTVIVKRRKPRSTKTEERSAPLLPTFLFAAAHHLDDLIFMSADPTRDGPGFSVVSYHDDRRFGGTPYPTIANAALEPLRLEEARALHKARPPVLPKGTSVNVTGGSFSGFSGVVLSSKKDKAWLDLGGNFKRVEIETFILRPKGLEDGRAEMAHAAKGR